ncbi:PIN domain-containing protein, partial [Dyadobacter sp.]|uniref:PIN domain-containing protein n=1 Tax=Dyadobacter sp. TaxID=1914288 RepID=UPI003F6FE3F7
MSIPRQANTRWLFDGLKNKEFQFGISNEILEEYEEVLGKFYSPSLATNIIELLLNLSNGIWVTPYYKWGLIKDQDDNKFVDCPI